MKQYLLIILTVIVLATVCSTVHGKGNAYNDTIKQRVIFIDSLINSFYKNPATTLIHTVGHYSCINQPYGGGSSDLYQDSTGKEIYQLTTDRGCDTTITYKKYYFIDNRIVFVVIRIKQNGKISEIKKFYKADRLITFFKNKTKKKQQIDTDLKDGYNLLLALNR